MAKTNGPLEHQTPLPPPNLWGMGISTTEEASLEEDINGLRVYGVEVPQKVDRRRLGDA